MRHTNTVLSKIERGEIPVRQLPSGKRTFALPAACKPRDPLAGLDLSKFTKTVRQLLLHVWNALLNVFAHAIPRHSYNRRWWRQT